MLRPKLAAAAIAFLSRNLTAFLEILDDRLPLGRIELKYVLQQHDMRFPGQKRMVDSIKRKFASLHRCKIPTGDPVIPPDVERAKNTGHKISERSDIGEVEGGSDENI